MFIHTSEQPYVSMHGHDKWLLCKPKINGGITGSPNSICVVSCSVALLHLHSVSLFVLHCVTLLCFVLLTLSRVLLDVYIMLCYNAKFILSLLFSFSSRYREASDPKLSRPLNSRGVMTCGQLSLMRRNLSR